MQNFSLELGEDGIASVTFAVPGKSVNVISQSVLADLDVLIEKVRSDPAIRGVILSSGNNGGFCAGADLGELLEDTGRWRLAQSQAELRAGVAEAGAYSRRLRSLETCGKPFAAILQGLALGGGLELALACHHRIAVDDGKLRMALPEASIGLMPGAGATQRLIRMLGIVGSLPHLLDGEPITVDGAVSAGVLHARAGTTQEAFQHARDWVLTTENLVAPWDAKGFKLPAGGPHTTTAYQFFGPAIAARVASAEEGLGIGNILKAIYEGAQVPMDAALRIESRYFFNTARSAEAQTAIERFFSTRTSKSAAHART